MDTRHTILATIGILLVVAVGVWWYFGFTLDFMRFFAAERVPVESCVPRPACMDDDPPCVPDLAPGAVLCPPERSIRVECQPETQTVQVGGMVNLTARGGYGTYEWFFPQGSRIGGVLVGPNGPVTNAISLKYDTPGIKKVTVQAVRTLGSPMIDSVACTVIVTETQY